MINTTIENRHPNDAYIVYKLQTLNELYIKEKLMIVLETISITTSYTQAIEMVLDNPSYFLVPHTVRIEKEPFDWAFLDVS